MHPKLSCTVLQYLGLERDANRVGGEEGDIGSGDCRRPEKEVLQAGGTWVSYCVSVRWTRLCSCNKLTVHLSGAHYLNDVGQGGGDRVTFIRDPR